MNNPITDQLVTRFRSNPTTYWARNCTHFGTKEQFLNYEISRLWIIEIRRIKLFLGNFKLLWDWYLGGVMNLLFRQAGPERKWYQSPENLAEFHPQSPERMMTLPPDLSSLLNLTFQGIKIHKLLYISILNFSSHVDFLLISLLITISWWY